MADHLTEEEQIEALKRWWNENWLSIVVPIVVILCGYLGWNAWQGHTEHQAQLASDQFSALTDAAQTEPGKSLTPEQKEKVGALAETILSEHSDSMYADMANMVMARILVEDHQLDAAAKRLQTVVDSGANASIKELAKARLARVLAANGESDKALTLLAQTPSDAYKALYAEIKGDIYLAQGDAEAANTAYKSAIDALPPSEFNRSSLLKLKRDAVALPAPEQTQNAAETAAEGDA